MRIWFLILWCLTVGSGPLTGFATVPARCVPVDTPPPPLGARLFGVPLLFYSPDTRWGAGAGGILTFGPAERRSSVTFSVAATQRRQWLVHFPFQLFSVGGRWRAYGEVSWYRYLYQYFGVGNAYPDDFIEIYTAQYPRVRLNALTRLDARGRHFVGLRYAADGYRIVEYEPDSEIGRNLLHGADGGLTSGLGPVWQFDTRDELFFPRRGWLVEGSILLEEKFTGSAFRFVRYTLNGSYYQPVGQRAVLASQAMLAFTTGRSPFFLLSQLGGNRRLRGYPDGKFRDRHLALLQTELRFPLVWRIKGVVFAAAGTVFGQPDECPRLRPNGGAGLRFEFDRRQHLHLRLDYGIGEGRRNRGYYLTVGEAF